MEISVSQYQMTQFLSGLTTGQIVEVCTAEVQLVADLTGSVIDTVLADSGSALRSNDLWNFTTFNPSGSLWNTRALPKDKSSAAIEAIVMLSEGLSSGSL